MATATNDHTPIQSTVPYLAKPECTPYLDKPPTGWFVLDVLPHQSRLDWVAVMIDCHPNDIKGWLPAHGPNPRPVQHGWLPIPGQHSNSADAWNAVESMIEDVGTAWWNGLRDDWRAFWLRKAGDTGRAVDAWAEYKKQSVGTPPEKEAPCGPR
jgi:hypothetical protein